MWTLVAFAIKKTCALLHKDYLPASLSYNVYNIMVSIC